ncbi:MAG: alpha-ribazole phosphatase [Anaerovibrio sp.]|uniref:alpha-ribazole phosphatase n=1 Tax=Anaerovibrio sp. TaxID=1872532 RepID=UPI0025DD09FA|nr:alpha-ribazole phosphatase [Anaerovibrio sp.]MCR5177243.1 alpha-ribazole phosphatase [Anaerovibrio sp.]
MKKIILVRHGQTAWNKLGKYQGQADVELSEQGRRQAQLLKENFPFDKVDAVYSSSLNRAVETAKAVAGKFGLKVKSCDDFKEINFGAWEGLTYDQIHDKWPVEHEKLFKCPGEMTCPDGESFADVQARAVAKLKKIIKSPEGENIVIAAHGGVIRTLLAYALGMPLNNMWHIRQDNTAVNLITAYDESMVVELMNSTVHLKGEFLDSNMWK